VEVVAEMLVARIGSRRGPSPVERMTPGVDRL
jgi:hypothetical protein